MILLYGRADDAPLRLAIEAAQDLEIDHVVVDQRHAPHHDLALWADGSGLGGRLVVSGREVELGEVAGVYVRPLEPVRGPDALATSRSEAFHAGFCEWVDAAPCRVMSRPAAMESNSSKPFQMQAIAAVGMAVPESLVTSDPAEVLAFRAEHGRLVFKSTSGVRSIVRELDQAALDRLDRIAALPTLFQAHVPGVDVRVHVVGAELFATEVASDAVDYRYARNDGLDAALSAVELPPEVAERCAALSRALDLPLCGIDLRRTPEGRWVCFEVNPMPGYSYYEQETGAPISAAIVRALEGGWVPCSHSTTAHA